MIVCFFGSSWALLPWNISLVNRFLWTGHALEKNIICWAWAENHGTVNFCAIWSIDFKSSEENMGMISSKGSLSLSWSILPEKNFWKLLSEAAGWKSDIACHLNHPHVPAGRFSTSTKVLAGVPSPPKDFPSFLAAKKKDCANNTQPTAWICATCHDDN